MMNGQGYYRITTGFVLTDTGTERVHTDWGSEEWDTAVSRTLDNTVTAGTISKMLVTDPTLVHVEIHTDDGRFLVLEKIRAAK